MKIVYKLLILFIICSNLAFSEEKSDEQINIIEGEAATNMIHVFLNEHWNKQNWHLEYREVEVLANTHEWFYKGTDIWVLLDGSPTLREKYKLSELDKSKTYIVTGILVNHAYNYVTLYMTSEPKVFSAN